MQVIWDFLASLLQISTGCRSRNYFLLASDGMSKTLKLQLAGAIYALHRAVQVHRHDDSGRQLNPMAVLQSWFKKSGIQHVQGARDIMTGSL